MQLLLLLATQLLGCMATAPETESPALTIRETAWRPHLFSLQLRRHSADCGLSTASSVLFQLLPDGGSGAAVWTVAAGVAASRCGLHNARLPSYREVYAMRSAVSADSLAELFQLGDTLEFIVTGPAAGYAVALGSREFRQVQLSPLRDAFANASVNCLLCLRLLDEGPACADSAGTPGDIDLGMAGSVLTCLLTVACAALAGLIVALLCVNACHLLSRRTAAAIGNSELDELVEAENATSDTRV